MKSVRDAFVGIALVFIGVSFMTLFSGHAFAANGINKEISFEGKIVNNSGVNIADSTHYNVEFKIYTGCTDNIGTGCSTNWTEDYLYNGTTGGVSFASGTFQVNLGSITSLASVPWGTNPLYLSIDIGNTASCTLGTFDTTCGGDTAMKPYILLTATPYAFNADELGGVASTGYVQNTPALAQTIQASADVNGLSVKGSGAGTTADIFDVQNSGNADIIQTTGAGALALVAQGTTQTLSVKTADSTTVSTGAITIQSGSASSGSNLSAGAVTIDTGTQTGIGTAALNIGASHALAIGIGNASSTTTFAGAITTGAGLATLGGNVTFSGTTARIITGPSTGGLTETVASGPLTVSTTTSGTLAVTSAGALNLTGAAISTWDIGANTLSLQTTNNGAITTGTGLFTHAGNVTFSGTTARIITGPSTGGLTETVASGPLTVSTTTSGTLAVTSAGALNLTGAAISTWDIGANTLSLQTTNNGAITTGTGLFTHAGNVTFSGTTARIITGPSTGGLTETVASGPLTVSTTTSGTLAVTSAGALNLTGAAISTWDIGANTLSLQTTNNGAITTGNGLLTVGTGGVAIKGSSTITAGSVPATDQLAITNAGFPVTAAGVNGLSINYTGGAAAVESAAERIDVAPGTLTGGTWSGIRVVPNATGAVSGVTEYGIKIDNLTTPGAGSQTGMYIGTGWNTGLDVASGGLILAGYTSSGSPSDPPAPSSGNLAVYSKDVSGRMLLKIKGPSGLDSPLQPALFGNNYVFFAPTSGATGTGSGFGTTWQSNGTVTHPTETTTNTGSQMHRTRYANVVTTTNQVLGPKINTADGDQFWTGNAAGLGGFFFESRFIVELYPATTTRLFAGLASGTTAVVASDTVAGDVVGLWHDTTDGANVLSLVTRNNVTTTKTNIPGATLTAGEAYDFYMFVKPDDTTVYYRLDDITLGTTVVDTSASVTMPRNTIFMGPQVEMSNGTANITVNTVGIGVNRIYVESDH